MIVSLIRIICYPYTSYTLLYSLTQTLLSQVSKELEEIKDTTSVLRKRLAEMMNSLLSDLVSDSIFGGHRVQ